MSIRVLAVSGLVLMLFEPILRFVTADKHNPQAIILVDNSLSMAITDRSRQRSKDGRDVVRRILESLDGRVRILTFGERVWNPVDFTADSMSFVERRTNIAAALIRAFNEARYTGRIGAVILASDGNSNMGDNPANVVRSAPVPVYSIGIGDTVIPVDIAVVDIQAPSICYAGDTAYVSATITGLVTLGQDVRVIVKEENLIRSERQVTMRSSNTQRIVFPIQMNTPGKRKVTVAVPGIATEFTIDNNSRSTVVDVVANKQRIMILANAPSPDLAAVVREVGADKGFVVKTFVQKHGAEFYGQPPQVADFEDADLLIAIGIPSESTPRNVVQLAANAVSRGLPLLYMLASGTSFDRMNEWKDVLPFRILSSRSAEYTVGIYPDPIQGLDPVLRSPIGEDFDKWSTLPPIFRPDIIVKPAATSRTPLRYLQGSLKSEEPFLMRAEDGMRRTVALLGYGLYRWRLLGEGPQVVKGVGTGTDMFSLLFGNSIRWLRVREDNRRVRIRPAEVINYEGDNISFLGSVLDETYHPVSDANVSVTLNDGSVFVLRPLGGGEFAADLGLLPIGTYTYKAIASRNGVTVGSDDGSFYVEPGSLERFSTTQNGALMKTIASLSGGKYVPWDGRSELLDSLIGDVMQSRHMQPIAYEESVDYAVWSSPWLLLFAVTMFGVEWTIRKRLGLP